MDEGCTYTDRIGPDADGETVARFYAARYRHSSEADWRARAEAGLVLRNGLPAAPDDRLRAGDVLRWNRPPWREPDVPRDVRVVLADDDVVVVDKPRRQLELQVEDSDLDGLNYLAGKDMDFVNKSAMNGTVLAHTDGDVPNLMVHMPAQDAVSLGALFYFFEFACGISGYLLGVNPFNQPGVESYKKNMFALLGKPGYEAAREELLKRL